MRIAYAAEITLSILSPHSATPTRFERRGSPVRLSGDRVAM
jgi:hypothetical protein